MKEREETFGATVSPDREIVSVTAAGAFDTRKCRRFKSLRAAIWGDGPPRSIAARGRRDRTAPKERQASKG